MLPKAEAMRLSLPNSLLLVAASACFVDAFRHPHQSITGPFLTGALGILLVLRGLAATPQPAAVTVSGCVLAILSVARDQGFLDQNSLWYIGLFGLAAGVIIFWRRIEKVWK
jgi:uncharacterized protein YjeT (DUF2065 family)